MNPNVVAAIEKIVLAFAKDGKMFTALDVSNTVKEQGHHVRHRDIAPVVRDIYEGGALSHFNYERSLIDVTLEDGTSTQTFLYYKQGADTNQYFARSQKAIDIYSDDDVTPVTVSTSRVTGVASVITALQSTVKSTPGHTKVARWADGRIALPTRFCKQLLEATNYTTVVARKIGGSLVVYTRVGTKEAGLCVKNDDRILLSSELLNQAFGSEQVFEVEFQKANDRILITKV